MSLSQSDTDFAGHSKDVDDLLLSPQHWLGLEQASDCLGMSQNHLRLAIDQGLLRANQDGDGTWRVYIKMPQGQAPLDGTASVSSSEDQPPVLAADQVQKEDQRSLERELRLEAREDRLVTLLQESLERREDQLSEKDRLLGDLSRQFSDLAQQLVTDRGDRQGEEKGLSAAQRRFDPDRYDRALANIRETLKLVRDYLLEQK